MSHLFKRFAMQARHLSMLNSPTCLKQRVPVIWTNRAKETLEPSQKKPTAEVGNLRDVAKLLGVS